MEWRIRDNSLLEKVSLKVDDTGVSFQKTAFLGGVDHFAFDQIDCVLLSASAELSFQVGTQVFSIQTMPYQEEHRQAIQALVDGTRRSTGR